MLWDAIAINHLQKSPNLSPRIRPSGITFSNLFYKLGVWTRAQAMVFAHDYGFSETIET